MENLRNILKIKNILNPYHSQDSKLAHCIQNSTDCKYMNLLRGSAAVYLLTENYRVCSEPAVFEVMVTVTFESTGGFIRVDNTWGPGVA